MNNDHMQMSHGTFHELFLILVFILLIASYIFAVKLSNQRFKRWPQYRIVLWTIGIMSVLITIVGPLADLSHTNFTAHMVGHLLLGMLGPLLLALSAPMTLILRTLPVKAARFLSRVLRNKYGSMLTNPIVTTILNIGGLWVLYSTSLYTTMQQHVYVHILIHVHIFLAGYFFTISLIYIDPTPYRFNYVFRTIVFIFALAGHEILAKYIYVNPPSGVTSSQAEIGGMLMYYGGDIIDIAIIFILFFQWYKATKPLTKLSSTNSPTLKA